MVLQSVLINWLIFLSLSQIYNCKFALLWSNESFEFNKVLDYVSIDWNLKQYFTKHLVNTSNPNSFQKELCGIARSNEKPIIGLLDLESRLMVESFTKHFNIPFITWSPLYNLPAIMGSEKIESCRIFSVQPDLTEPLINFLIQWKWNHFVYIYRKEYSFYRINNVLHELYSHETSDDLLDVTPVYLPTDEKGIFHTLRVLDQKISKMNERKIVIDLDGRNEVEELLRCLKLLGMLRQEYHYLMVNFRIMQLPLSSYKSSRVNITGFHILDYLHQETRGFITQWTRLLGDEELSSVAFILDAFRVLQSLFNNNRFRNPATQNKEIDCSSFSSFYNTSVNLKINDGKDLIDYIKSINTIGQTGSIIFDNKTCVRKNATIILTKFNGQGGGEIIAKSNPDSTWEIMVSNEKNPNEENIHLKNRSHVIRVVTILANPFVMPAPDSPKDAKVGKKNFEGYCIDLAEDIFAMINMSYEIHLVKDNSYGAYIKENDTWNGMVGELINGDADIAIAPLTVSSSRAKFITFTEPFMTFGLSLIMKKPVETKPGVFSFMKPLSDNVWICTGSACLFIAIGLRVIANISPYEWKREEAFNMGNSFWFSFAAVVRQGAEIFPKSPGARILASIWWMFSLVHIAYYTANLAAFLSVANLISPISKINDLVEKKDLGIKVGTLDAGSTKEFFATSTFHPYNKIYEIMQKDPTVYTKTIDEGVTRVREEQGKYVFILESKMNEYKNNRHPCDTMMVGNAFGSKAYAVATRSNDNKMLDMKEQITDAILQLREKQTLAKLYTKWWIKKGECTVESGGSASKPLALANLSGVFYILFFGIMLSLVLGLTDFLYKLHQIKQKRKLNQYAETRS